MHSFDLYTHIVYTHKYTLHTQIYTVDQIFIFNIIWKYTSRKNLFDVKKRSLNSYEKCYKLK